MKSCGDGANNKAFSLDIRGSYTFYLYTPNTYHIDIWEKKMNLWEKSYTPWKSKSQYINWIRGGLRKLWSRHPSKAEIRKQNREKRDNGKGRMVYHNLCAMCNVWHKTADTEIDHLKCNPPFKEMQDIAAYAENLLNVGVEDLQILCKPCHKIKTYAERYGVSLEEARKRKGK